MKKIISSILIGILFLGLFGCSQDNKPSKQVYGNTNEEIVDYIYESTMLNGVEKNSITVLGPEYYNNTKIVGFAHNKVLGLMYYNKNNNDYVFSSSNYKDYNTQKESSYTGLLVSNLLNYSSCVSKQPKSVFAVISDGSKVSKLDLILNGKHTITTNLEIGKPSLTLIKKSNLSPSEGAIISVDYVYYDKNNNEIKIP